MEAYKTEIEKIEKLYFAGVSLKEAIDIVNKNIKIEDTKVSKGWQYQQLRI